MNPAQFTLFEQMLTIRARAIALLVTAVHISKIQRIPLEDAISQALSNAKPAPQIVTMTWALRDELAATARFIQPTA